MPLRTHAAYLRDRAQRLREIAKLDPKSPLTPQLLDVASDLEERAMDLEQEQDTAEAKAALKKAKRR